MRSGVDGVEVPPVPIPNTVVKLNSADNTWLEAAREDRAMPERRTATVVLFFFVYEQAEDVLSAFGLFVAMISYTASGPET